MPMDHGRSVKTRQYKQIILEEDRGQTLFIGKIRNLLRDGGRITEAVGGAACVAGKRADTAIRAISNAAAGTNHETHGDTRQASRLNAG